MTTRVLIFVLALVLQASLSAAELTVQTAASLTDAMKEIGATYEKTSGDKIHFNFGASNFLARQIEEGAPADMFFSADEAKMDDLEKKDLLLKGTRRSLLSNLLVIVVATDATMIPTSLVDLTKRDYQKIAIAEPHTVPAGIYASEYLQKAGFWDAVKGKIIPTENVRAALAAVESGNVDAGFVYKTDALISKKVKVAIEIPAADGPKISYPVAVTKSSKEPESARKFGEFLAGATARSIFEKFGFIVTK